MTIWESRERYRSDKAFRLAVDMLLLEINKRILTPNEIREAALLAQIMYVETEWGHMQTDGTFREELDGPGACGGSAACSWV